MNVELISYTADPVKVIETAASTCYDSEPTEGKIMKHCYNSGHHSVLEFAEFTFKISGVSRALTHQLVRHRLASFAQRSQRYCFEDGFNYIEPEDMNEEEDKFFRDFMRHSKEVYSKLIDKGVKPEDARMVLPNACETKIIVTMNARELLHFFKLRCCKRAQKEIREVAFMMKNICRKVAPNIFQYAGPNCLKGYCTEGENSCMKDNDNIKKIIP